MSKNTTTCWICGHDYPDNEMMPLPEEGEICQVCLESKDKLAIEELYDCPTKLA